MCCSKTYQWAKSIPPATSMRSLGQSLYLLSFFKNVISYVFSDRLIYHSYLAYIHVFIFPVTH